MPRSSNLPKDDVNVKANKTDIEQVNLNPIAGKQQLTRYFKTENGSSQDEELFFGNGIVLHKLRTTVGGRYYNYLALIKLFSFEPAYVSLQGLPSMQIASIFILQTLYFAWIVHCGLVQKMYISKAAMISDILTEASLLIFIVVGLIFQSKGGADQMQPSISNGLQFTGMIFIGIACIANLAEFVSMLILKFKNMKNEKKVNEYIKNAKMLRDERYHVKKPQSSIDNSRLLNSDEQMPSAIKDEPAAVNSPAVPLRRRYKSFAYARKIHVPGMKL